MLNQDFKDILSAFIVEKVEFLIVGGYAMAFHGYVRATGDIDLWVRCSDENAGRIWRALQTFGAPLFDLNIEDLKTPGMVFQIGLIPSRIDVITQIDGVELKTLGMTIKPSKSKVCKFPLSVKLNFLSIKNPPAGQKTAMMRCGSKMNNFTKSHRI